ncbi:hypothetical protein PTKIN_Ptkin17bG0015500 [Pterospermum kingtungense]
MSTELDQVFVPCLSSSSEGQEAFLCIPLANMFPNNIENNEDQLYDDAYMEEILLEIDDVMDVLEDVVAVNIDPPKMMRPASRTTIEGLEKIKVGEKSLAPCSICFEDVSMGTEASRLPHSHIYHTSCILNGLKRAINVQCLFFILI